MKVRSQPQIKTQKDGTETNVSRGRLRVLLGSLGGGNCPDEEEIEAAVLARLGEGVNLFDYDAFSEGDDEAGMSD